MRRFVFIVCLLSCVSSGFILAQPLPQSRILGLWESADNDLRIEMYQQKGQYAGRLVWFLCEGDDPPMAAHYDTENPNPALRSRPWLGLNSVEKLTYQGDDVWSGGKVYDPNTGHTFEATVRLTDPDNLIVRGYWKFPVLGRSLYFHRISPTPKSDSDAIKAVKAK